MVGLGSHRFLGPPNLSWPKGFSLNSLSPRGTTSLHPVQAACLYLSHQVQVIHVARLLVCLSARQLVLVTMTTGCKAPGHQWAVALVGAVPWAGRGLVSSSRGKLGKGWSLRGLRGPSLPQCFGISFLPSVLGAEGGAKCHSWWEGSRSRWVGGTALPIWAVPPTQVLKALFQGPLLCSSGHCCLLHHTTAFSPLDTNEKFKTQLSQKIGLWVRSKDPGILVLREGSREN